MFDIDARPSSVGAGDSLMRAHEGVLASFFADDPESGCSSRLPDATATSGSLRDGLVTPVAAFFAYEGIPRKPARFDFVRRPIAIEERDVEAQKRTEIFYDARALGTKKHHGNLAF